MTTLNVIAAARGPRPGRPGAAAGHKKAATDPGRGPRAMRRTAALALLALAAVRADDLDRLTVGPQPDGRVVVPTNQILQPAGRQVLFPGRPVDLLVVEDGRTLAVKNTVALTFIDVATGAVRQTLTLPSRGQDRTGF